MLTMTTQPKWQGKACPTGNDWCAIYKIDTQEDKVHIFWRCGNPAADPFAMVCQDCQDQIIEAIGMPKEKYEQWFSKMQMKRPQA